MNPRRNANEGLACASQIVKKRVSRRLSTVVVGGLFTFEQNDGRGLITGPFLPRSPIQSGCIL